MHESNSDQGLSKAMAVPAGQVAYKKKVGKLDGKDVWELGLRGGLHMVVVAKGAGAETLGVGPHRAVARHIAQRRNPELQITELSKAEEVRVEDFAFVLPRYEALTDQFRKR